MIRPTLLVKCMGAVAVIMLLSGNVKFSRQSRLASILSPYHPYVNGGGGQPSVILPTVTDSTFDDPSSSLLKFYILPTPEVTDWLLGNYSDDGYHYYENALNEDQAELWIYRGLQQHPSRTLHPEEADVFVVCGCLHWNYHRSKYNDNPSKRRKRRPRENGRNISLSASATILDGKFDAKAFATTVRQRVIDKEKPHLIAIPTTNPGTSRYIGLKAIVKALTNGGVTNLWSFGFERNQFWQGLPPDRIIPIPYVVRLDESDKTRSSVALESSSRPSNQSMTSFQRTPNFVFYIGDKRHHAQEWSGCDRSMVAPLETERNMDVRLIDKTPGSSSSRRLSQTVYNHRMASSEYCLILCGDSPTSRSLTSAVVSGCIPLIVGSRLRGLCEAPCHKGWGWTISGSENPHLPFFGHRMNWTLFPEVDEALFQEMPAQVLRQALDDTTREQREAMIAIMQKHREGFIYGRGNPINSTLFGNAVEYIWGSFEMTQQSILRQR